MKNTAILLFKLSQILIIGGGLAVLRYFLSFDDTQDCSFDVQAPITTLILLIVWVITPISIIYSITTLKKSSGFNNLNGILSILLISIAVFFVIVQLYTLIFIPDCSTPFEYLSR